MDPSLLRIVLPIPLALAMVACSESAAPDSASEPAERPVPERAADATGSGAVYACSNGATIKIGDDGLKASITLQDGRELVLPRAESASKGGGDVFVGEALSVHREGRTAQLHQDQVAAVGCAAS